MLAEALTVVGKEDQDGIVEQLQPLQRVCQIAQTVVDVANLLVIAIDERGQVLGRCSADVQAFMDLFAGLPVVAAVGARCVEGRVDEIRSYWDEPRRKFARRDEHGVDRAQSTQHALGPLVI